MKASKGAVFFIAVLLLVSIIFVSGCTDKGSEGGDSRIVKSGDTVKVDYTGKLEDGTVFDTSREDVAKQAGIYVEGREYAPLTFVVGSGQVIQGFDEGVIGMKVGEEKTLKIPPEEAYGEYDKAKILAVPIEELNLTNRSEIPEVGQSLRDINGNQYKVTAVNDTHITLDVNHELAGKTLTFDIKLISIE
ncbi:FKBP-type peptidyl-prolyl cis-trans isomerase SlyD [Methanosarcina barkeri 3]|uniref:Peptidyl-prolyl cis-trans isomerase n=1 Tax=Methanosarcina barkeri 3 TaxID=1434107 RepID=A0A0E3SLS5_METBA|nr:peptidylprolyl isomerase [Methanosarcina barkeri]AKB82237.1 FKBP-type peptidyl-prolyl cis-trans isomerase SlyD [Methanosarcina barkeri 3]